MATFQDLKPDPYVLYPYAYVAYFRRIISLTDITTQIGPSLSINAVPISFRSLRPYSSVGEQKTLRSRDRSV